MPTTAQLQPQNQSNQITVSEAAYSVTFAQGSGSANHITIATAKTATPRRGFNWFRSLLADKAAIPAFYGLLAPLVGLHLDDDLDFVLIYLALPSLLIMVLGLTRKSIRASSLTGVIFGFVSGLAFNVEIVFRGMTMDDGRLIFATAAFMICGMILGTFAGILRWLFAPNRP